jgi:hypothetical protein
MSNTDAVIEDEKKTAFDWCKEGNTSHLVQYLKNTQTDVNIQDENVRKILHSSCFSCILH